uniref:phosphatidylinositol 4,5-bisphosphate 3-kinase catalytic subunit beta isoform-like isoform X1 n=1 Tax=Ciona intestinalis TaxID=7719 RepID=UPI0002B8E927|nr:phosphatidylinositol 4,5-bisphosphate 3-kinase catalytic subunit beta isoform-like isoform X1 [Ciona intestinalis]|eukprot:XP_002122027.2 phosphatidylinositol 4,5-bisphosphate 3-kinase catalytic subunit beta isoform-like isoform X1 [Ciona intestinalis]
MSISRAFSGVHLGGSGGAYDEEESIYDEWGYHNSMYVSVDFFLPTGIYIPIDIPRNSTIKEVKNLLWQEAIHHPLFSKLLNPESYTFTYITSFGLPEEIVDESRHLSEFDIFHELPVLKLVQSRGNIAEKRVIQEINHLTCIKNETELNVDSESRSFRKDMRELAAQACKDRDTLHWKSLLQRHFPPTIIPYLNESTHYLKDFGLIQLTSENSETVYTIKINPSWSTEHLTEVALQTWVSKTKARLPSTNKDDYVLKGNGKEFIVGNHPIYMFKFLRKALVCKREGIVSSIKAPPVVSLVHVASVRKILPQQYQLLKKVQTNFAPPVPEKHRAVWSLWQLDVMFKLRIIRAGNVNAGQERDKKLVVHVGLYHGTETLCPTTYTKEPVKEMAAGNEYQWDEECFFDINAVNLPRNAMLCLAICSSKRNVGGKSKRKESTQKNTQHSASPIAWANMMVFDFKRYLKAGLYRLNCWQVNHDNLDSNNLSPRGGVMLNPDVEQAAFIEIMMPEYQATIMYPSLPEVLEEAARQAVVRESNLMTRGASKSHMTQLDEVVRKDRFDDLFDDDKSLLWRLRIDCREKYPEALSKVLASAKWNSYKSVAMVQAMLNSWTPLSPERAMELLDCQFADEHVRDFAVKCLENLRDDELQQYLMQLVQVVKFDSYLNSSLVRFILRRAWSNRKIGHFLFWHLKAEISNTLLNLRFALIMEAYLYGNLPHVKTLYKQQEALNKMRTLNERVKGSEFSQKDIKVRARQALKDTANQDSFKEALTSVECPLEPNLDLEELLVEKCKVMNSKMRPLWLVFKNKQVQDGSMSVIYKNGDDLRQDMLTLQTISIMDMLWKAEGLDLRMIPYGCLATGKGTGMIEVVTHSNTIANIQKTRGGKMSAFRHQTLIEWLEQNNSTPSEFEQAIENFTYSCAGYCVATFVLGVGDRHSDNIMVTEKGQLFHIDFGHILGNFKTKFGIKRERVPFVLAHDFVHVINKGKTNNKADFDQFRKLCDNAFCILRKKGYLIITLFALMLHSGLPEMTSLDHLEYLRETLALHLTEQKALQQFRSKFNKALTDAWATSVNWFFHNVARDNT